MTASGLSLERIRPLRFSCIPSGLGLLATPYAVPVLLGGLGESRTRVLRILQPTSCRALSAFPQNFFFPLMVMTKSLETIWKIFIIPKLRTYSGCS